MRALNSPLDGAKRVRSRFIGVILGPLCDRNDPVLKEQRGEWEMGEQRKATDPNRSIGTWYPKNDSIRLAFNEAIEDIDHSWAICRDSAGGLSACQGGHAELEVSTGAPSSAG